MTKPDKWDRPIVIGRIVHHEMISDAMERLEPGFGPIDVCYPAIIARVDRGEVGDWLDLVTFVPNPDRPVQLWRVGKPTNSRPGHDNWHWPDDCPDLDAPTTPMPRPET